MVKKRIAINVHIKVEHLAIERYNSHEKRVIPRQTVTFQSDEREREKKKSALQRTEKQACIVNRWTRTSEFRHSRVAVCCRLDVFNKSASGSKRRWKLSCILVEERRVKFNISSKRARRNFTNVYDNVVQSRNYMT